MEHRKLGSTGPRVSSVGLGTMTWGRDTDELVRRNRKERDLRQPARGCDALDPVRHFHRPPRGIRERIGILLCAVLYAASREDAGEDEQHGKKEIFFTRHIAHLVFPIVTYFLMRVVAFFQNSAILNAIN